MSIRLRKVDGHLVALCAARSEPKEGDIYLGDEVHHALNNKFSQDFNSEAVFPRAEDSQDNARREQEESNNAYRTEWDKRYA